MASAIGLENGQQTFHPYAHLYTIVIPTQFRERSPP
jgi:hypothetical protein